MGIGGPKPAVGTPSLEAPDALDEARFEARTRSEEPAASSAVEPPSTATEADPFISVPEEEAPISGESEPSTPEPSFPPFGGFGDPAEVPAPGLNADPIFNPGGEIDNTPNNPAPETDFPNLDFPPLDNPPPSNDLDLGMLDQKLQEQLGLGHDSTPNSLNSPRISSSADDVPIELPLGLTADDERAVATSSGELSVEQVTYEVPVRELEIFDAEDAYVKNPLRGKLRREARNGPTEVAATSDVDGTELTSPQDAAPQPPSRVAPHSESAAQPQRHAKLVGGMNRDLRETLRKNPLR